MSPCRPELSWERLQLRVALQFAVFEAAEKRHVDPFKVRITVTGREIDEPRDFSIYRERVRNSNVTMQKRATIRPLPADRPGAVRAVGHGLDAGRKDCWPLARRRRQTAINGRGRTRSTDPSMESGSRSSHQGWCFRALLSKGLPPETRRVAGRRLRAPQVRGGHRL
jgi:hypothetical protein